MKIIDVDRLNDMILDIQDLNDLIKIGLTEEEIEGYLDFFGANIVTPFSTIFE